MNNRKLRGVLEAAGLVLLGGAAVLLIGPRIAAPPQAQRAAQAAPPVERVVVTDGVLPPRGPADALVTIVEFSDYHCPFCRHVEPVLRRVLERYPDEVRLVYRDSPIDTLHPNARRASEAGRCANDQGRFWAFHDILYDGASDSSPMTPEAAARLAGLDADVFERCLTDGTHRAAVQADVEEADQLRVSVTPTFFINGRRVAGAQSLEKFIETIEQELARVKS